MVHTTSSEASDKGVDVDDDVDVVVLKASWQKPTEARVAHQRQRLGEGPTPHSTLLSIRLFPQKPQTPSTPPSRAARSSSSQHIGSSSSHPASIDTDSRSFNAAIKADLMQHATGRHVPLFYTLEGTPECDERVAKLMKQLASQRTNIMDALTEKRSKHCLEERITAFGNAYRSLAQLADGQHNTSSSYGKLVSSGMRSVANPAVDYWCEPDPERHKPDILVLDADVVRPEENNWYDWSKLVSFIQVKKHSRQDCTDGAGGPLLQCIGYTRKLLQYSPMRSHLHFVTWCGPLVRLWYVDAAQFGCSQAYSIAKEEDCLDIGRIFYLLASSACRDLLSSRWNPNSHPPSGSVPPRWTGKFVPCFVRPGPFGSRTMLWVAQPADPSNEEPNKKVFLKLSWVVPRLVDHEFDMQNRLADLRHTPTPLGFDVLPASAAGFKIRTSQTGDDSQTGLRLSVLLYEHRFGWQVESTAAESCLAELHAQFADQLLEYAKRGLHYRDLNSGNFLVEDKTSNTLVVADHGNMRAKLRPRGDQQAKRATEFVQRAQDDARSANGLFLPIASLAAMRAVRKWEVRLPRGVLKPRNGVDPYGDSIIKDATDTLLDLRKQLFLILANSHRYIDDLESAAYLHLWQGAQRSFELEKSYERSNELMELLANLHKKEGEWTDPPAWEQTVEKYCSRASTTWIMCMRQLNRIIYDAQQKLRAEIVTRCDDKFSVEQAEQDLKRVIAANQAGDIKEAVCKVLDDATPHLMHTTEGVLATEIRCFEDCAKELRNTARKLELEERETGEQIG